MNRSWSRFWMRFSSVGGLRSLAIRLATWGTPPQKGRVALSVMNEKGYISAKAIICHEKINVGTHIFIDDGVEIFQSKDGGRIKFGDRVRVYRDTIIETGLGGEIVIGDHTSIHPRCQLNAYLEKISIGNDVMIAANCAIYPYDHGVSVDQPIHKQPLHSKSEVIIDDEAWLGYGVIVLSGVHIGKGAVIGAGSVVTKDVPDYGIVAGNPAKVLKMRSEISS